eukprot:m.278886 g.278886  ORF g.278886 m.278886 type:complete len:1499 (+) comp40615_c0_seq6:5702-10198(+)
MAAFFVIAMAIFQLTAASLYSQQPLCKTPMPPANGRVTTIGLRAFYSCIPGYKLNGGNKERTCNKQTGVWVGQEPKCILCCKVPKNPLHGEVKVSGVEATYECRSGYRVQGAPNRICNGYSCQFLGEAPKCVVGCISPPDPCHGNVKVTGTVATFSCKDGFKLVGQHQVHCINDLSGRLRWDKMYPICVPACSELPSPKNGKIVRVDDKVKYHCDFGFELVGKKERTCNSATQSYDGSTPVCIRVCKQLPDISHGRVEYNGPYAEYHCDSGFSLSGYSIRLCNNGPWTGKEPQCLLSCSPLEHPFNGKVVVQDDTATYTCDNGFRLHGKATRTCNVGGAWSGSAPTCPLSCKELSAPDNGAVCVDGALAKYHCNYGFRLRGPAQRTCNNGVWSGNDPTCTLLCTVKINIQYGDCTQDGAKLTCKCNAGYILYGSSVRYCNPKAKKWTGIDVECRRGCSSLYAPTNGKVVYNNLKTTYSCFSGYKLVGKSERTCDGIRWSDLAPKCVSGCPKLTAPANGQVYIYGSDALYSCDYGFTISGNVVRKCQANHQWSGNAPKCSLTCPVLSNPANGKVAVDGAVATYSCNQGFHLESYFNTRYCFGKVWSGSEPRCALACPKLPNPVYGTVTVTGRKATYTCNAGFKLFSGATTRECRSDDYSWSGKPPICLLGCKALSSPNNGIVAIHGATAKYACDGGFKLVNGDAVRHCQANTFLWKGKAPKCVVACSDLTNPDNGKVIVKEARATYTCNDGYKLSETGNAIRVCNCNNKWSGSAPTCKLACPHPYSPIYGSVTLNGAVATYSCKGGYKLFGVITRKCDSSSFQWTLESPICKQICKSSQAPEHGYVSVSGNTATYACQYGYKLQGSQTRQCNDGIWNGVAATCVIGCAAAPPVSNCGVSYSGLYAVYTCHAGYILDGYSNLLCSGYNYKWYRSAPKCVRACPVLPDLLNGNVDDTAAYGRYTCDAGYKLNGPETRECNEQTRSWTLYTPVCELACSIPEHPEHGYVSVIGNKAHYECYSGFVLKGSQTRTCSSKGKWSEEAPTCQLACSDLTPPAYSTVVYDGSRAEFVCNKDYKLIGCKYRYCDSSSGQYYPVEETKCEISCIKPPNPHYGEVTVNGPTATYTCNEGYTLTGSHSRKCDVHTGLWTGYAPTCPIACETLKDPAHGKVHIFGHIAYYQCDLTYELSGTDERVCSSSTGQWSGSAPTCKPKCSSSLPAVPGGGIIIDGSSGNIHCLDGYIPYGDTEVTCNGKETKWVPKCDPSKCCQRACGDLSHPLHGTVTISGRDAAYACNAGYVLVGFSTRECTSVGTWTGTPPTCELACSGICETTENGIVLVEGNMATYRCDYGFKMTGVAIRKCDSVTRQWAGMVPKCNLACVAPLHLTNGNVTFYKGQAIHQCAYGFKLLGSPIRDCNSGSSKWEPAAPTCHLACSDPSKPINGKVEKDGGRAIYSCLSGYDLIGLSIRHCSSFSETWSGIAPKCVANARKEQVHKKEVLKEQ